MAAEARNGHAEEEDEDDEDERAERDDEDADVEAEMDDGAEDARVRPIAMCQGEDADTRLRSTTSLATKTCA